MQEKYTESEVITAMKNKSSIVFRRFSNEAEIRFDHISGYITRVRKDGKITHEVELSSTSYGGSVAFAGINQITILKKE